MIVTKFGEVYIVQFPFTSGGMSKKRPVLVLFDLRRDAVICRVTSVPHNDPLDVPILDWAEAGLAKPSVARLNRLVTAEKSLFGKRLGQLSVSDATRVRTAWNQHMTL
jgi:mRNA-degrading endonuclease toxin of MazEF toxin-antitoxin module